MTRKQEYMKERRRVQSLIHRYEKKGYDVEINIPSIVKKPTQASINRLKKITPKLVRSQSFVPDIETGEKINYYTLKIRFPKLKSEDAFRVRENVKAETTVFTYQMAIDHVMDIIEKYPDRMENIMKGRILSAINEHGEKAVGEALDLMLENNEIIDPDEAYNYQKTIQMANTLMRYCAKNAEDLTKISRMFNEEIDSFEEYEGEYYGWS